MTTTIRRIAVSGGAAVALLGSAAVGATATEEHTPAAIHAAYRADANDPAGVTNGITPDNGSGSALQNPLNTPGAVQTGVNDQVVTQASGGTVAVGIVAILVLGIVVFVRVKGKDVKAGDAVILTLFGIAISGTVIGAMGNQMTTSLVSSLGGVLGGL
jgi:hypothetical protein